MQKELKEIFYKRRKELNLSQLEVANRAGIKRSTYTRIENGSRPNPRFGTVCSIAAALGQVIILPDMVTYTQNYSSERGEAI